MADSSAEISAGLESPTSNGSLENFDEKDEYPVGIVLPRKSSVLKRDGRHGPKRTLQKSVSFSSRPEEKKIINGENFQFRLRIRTNNCDRAIEIGMTYHKFVLIFNSF